MVLLSIGAGLVFADMTLMAVWNGNGPLLYSMLAAGAFAGYTLCFIGISAITTHD